MVHTEVNQKPFRSVLKQAVKMNEIVNEFKPLVGRDKEILQLMEILNRKEKNNPILIGEAGVGKTAIVEGFVNRLVNNDVPSKLKDKQVLRLDVSDLVENSKFRGELEGKVKEMLAELEVRDDVFLFIDEIHLLMGSGKSDGGMDLSNLLKPALARGKARLIGATTINEFKALEADKAFERRFQPIVVDEPSKEQTLKILEGLKDNFGDYHNVEYTTESLVAMVDYSTQYISERFLPDKAIDLMDELGAKRNLTFEETDVTAFVEREEELTEALYEQVYKKQFHEALQTRLELDAIIVERDEVIQNSKGTYDRFIKKVDVKQLIEQKTGILVTDLDKSDLSNLSELQEKLSSMVIGQADAVNAVVASIQRNRLGLGDENRPIGCFLFVGPTGVGKTELAKALASLMFGDAGNMTRLDMSEYVEGHTTAKIIGSPPGYVGFNGENVLDKIRKKPFQVILVDELEKAHQNVQNIFLQGMEDGFITNSVGQKVNLRNTVMIFTSNAGNHGEATASIGFAAETVSDVAKEQAVMERLKKSFAPEFLNRFDSIVEFNRMNDEMLSSIFDTISAKMENRFSKQGIKFRITDNAKKHLVELGNNKDMGARPLRRVLTKTVEDGVTKAILTGSNSRNFLFDLVGNDVTIVNSEEELSIKEALDKREH